ncbi:MAG: hypothetical protein JWL77_4928 [Chthonomonadaceae bacterium]|nr:hypothetical protein [Chthonomonadaceae bacterium]
MAGWIVAFSMLLMAPVTQAQTSAARTIEWKHKAVQIEQSNSSLEQALGLLSEHLGRNVIAEGRPLPLRIDLRLHGTAEEACNRIADAYDYEWHEDASGFLLFTKRFQTEQERPQIHPEELRASIHDMLAAMRAVYRNDQPSNGLYSQVFQEIVNGMPKEQHDAMLQGEPIPIRSLSADLQSKATGIIYDNSLRQFSTLWTTLDQMLSHLDQETIVLNRRAGNSLVDKGSPGYTAIFQSKYRHPGPVLLDSGELKNASLPEESKAIVSTENRPVSNSVVGHNASQAAATSLRLGEVSALFGTRYGMTCDVASELKNREILLALHGATSTHLLEAIADLHHWRGSVASPGHYKIRRKQYRDPDNIVQMGLTFQQYMPTDIARFLLAISQKQLETPGYKMDTQPNVPTPNLSNYVRDHLRTLRIAEARVLLEHDGGESKRTTIPYAGLLPPARERFLLVALLVVGERSIGDIWRLRNHPASYQQDPFHSVLLVKNGYSIVGPGGDSITFRPISKIPTITIPGKK